MKATAFGLQHVPQAAGWLRSKLQAELLQHGKSLLLSADPPPLYLKADFQRSNGLFFNQTRPTPL